jgi:hypothetical protein
MLSMFILLDMMTDVLQKEFYWCFLHCIIEQ